MKQIQIYLLRHGKTEGKPALYGHTDIHVEEHIQRNIAHQIKLQNWQLGHIITSPLKRCLDLSNMIKKQYPLAMFTINNKLMEMNFGDYDGAPFEHLSPESWNELNSFWASPAAFTLSNAESLDNFHKRVINAWELIIRQLKKDTLIVCHAGVIRLLLAHALKLDWKQPTWHSALRIEYQSLSHVQLIIDKEVHYTVRSISSTI